jgi:SAM-dependent methyltransferase
MIAVRHHLDAEAALRTVARLLAPGGRFLAVALARPESVPDLLWEAVWIATNPLIGYVKHPRPTLQRLSHVVRRLEDRGLVERFPCPQDGRATNARLTPAGWTTVVDTAPGHVATVRNNVIDALTPEQTTQLAAIAEAILERIDPDGTMSAPQQDARP